MATDESDFASMIRTFKILRSNDAPLVVRGRLVAEGVGIRHIVQVIQTGKGCVLVLGDFCDGWQIVLQYSIGFLSSLMDHLRGLAEGKSCPTVRALVTHRPDSPQVRQDLLEAVDLVLCTLGSHQERSNTGGKHGPLA